MDVLHACDSVFILEAPENDMSIEIARPPIGEEEIRAVTEVLRSGKLVQGEKVGLFEGGFSDYMGSGFAVAVSSGTAALQIGLQALGVQKGDEVITTPFTFAATANAIIHCGGVPVFADIDPATFNISPEKIDEKVTDRTKAVVCVHLYGLPCEMDAITKICRDRNLMLVEDAAQAAGAEYKGRKVGTFGQVSAFSFYATKNITTGEGGMLLASQQGLAEKMRVIRNQGQTRPYRHDIISYNFRMTDIQAAMGIEQLKKLESLNAKRIENARYLTDSLSGIECIEVPAAPKHAKHVFHQYTIKISNGRDKLLEYLNRHGIGARVYYPEVLYMQPPYLRMGFRGGLCPVSEEACGHVLSLPVHPMLSQKELESVADSVRKGAKEL